MAHEPRRVAAVDIGTNSTRLLIAEADRAGGLTSLDRRLVMTRLGQGVDAGGRLAPEAIDRVVRAVEGYAAAWRAADVHDPADIAITATSASRDADNADEFRQAVLAVAGVEPQVIPGEVEAYLAFRGAVSALGDVPRPVAVIDIGGGSTEVIVGSDGPERSTSRQLGSVRLTERVLRDDPPTPAQVEEARRTIAVELDAVEALVGPSSARTLVGVAGTVTTVAAVHLDLDGWEDGRVHGHEMTAAEVRATADRLLGMPSSEIARLGSVQSGREDVIAAGALILAEVVERFGFPEVRVSEADVLDGLALRLLRGQPLDG